VATRTYLGIFCCLTLLAGTLRAQSSRKNEGALLFSQNCASCHGSDGGGGEHAPNIASRHEVVAATDAQLKDTVGKGIPEAGMPSFDYLGDEKVDELVAYLRTLQGVGGGAQTALPGDAAAGGTVFFGKAACSSCHMVRGKGGFLAEDLSEYAAGRSVGAIRAAIVNPGASAERGGHLASVALSDGTKYEGVMRAQNNFTVVLQTKDGAFHSISRDRIATLGISKEPLMPGDYGKTLTTKELNDVVSYLIESAKPMKPMRVGKDY
jgi:cytochrome c oxidase cbb3-type subunit III